MDTCLLKISYFTMCGKNVFNPDVNHVVTVKEFVEAKQPCDKCKKELEAKLNAGAAFISTLK